jgi:hypothetical protein
MRHEVVPFATKKNYSWLLQGNGIVAYLPVKYSKHNM